MFEVLLAMARFDRITGPEEASGDPRAGLVWGALRYIGPMNITSVSEITYLDRATVRSHATDMVGRGLLRRDGRIFTALENPDLERLSTVFYEQAASPWLREVVDELRKRGTFTS